METMMSAWVGRTSPSRVHDGIVEAKDLEVRRLDSRVRLLEHSRFRLAALDLSVVDSRWCQGTLTDMEAMEGEQMECQTFHNRVHVFLAQ